MQFKEYFHRDGLLWKRLRDGSEIALTGESLGLLVDTRSNAVLEHGDLRLVRQTQTAYRRAYPAIDETRIQILSRSLATIGAAEAHILNAALAAHDVAALRRLLDSDSRLSAA